jgi:hypothetical protein
VSFETARTCSAITMNYVLSDIEKKVSDCMPCSWTPLCLLTKFGTRLSVW